MSLLSPEETLKAIEQHQARLQATSFKLVEGLADWVVEEMKMDGRNVVSVEPVAVAPALPFFQSIALPLAARGLKVIPVNGKVATLKNHPEEATSDAAKITNDWAQYAACNVAVHCLQQEGGTLIVDSDGFDPVAEYKKETGEDAPVTYTVQSTPPQNGKIGKTHQYFRQTARTIALPKNITEDATGGRFSLRLKNFYAVGEGSIHPVHKGIYTAINSSPVLDMPDDYLDWLLSKVEKSKQESTDKKSYQPPAPGERITENRNTRCHDYAFYRWTADSVTPEELQRDVYAFNQTYCVPPLDESELDRTVIPSVQKFRQRKDEMVTFNGVPAGSASSQETPVEWREPGTIDSSLSPVLPFKLEYLPSSLRPWAQDVSERMSVPLDFTGVCALVTLAGVVCRRAFVYPRALDKEWKEALVLCGAVVASSGQTKTPTWKAIQNPLVELEYDYRAEHDKRVQAYEQAVDDYKKTVRNLKKGGELTEPEPTAPAPCKRVMTNNATPEKLHMLMKNNPGGIFVFRDELSGWVADLDKEGRESDREIYLCAMNGNDAYSMDRILRGDNFAVMSASFFAGCQPVMLLKFLNDVRNVSDGLFQRFGVLVYPDVVRKPRIDRLANDGAKQMFRHVIRTCAAMAPESVQFHFSQEAQERFDSWYDRHAEQVAKEANPAKQSHLMKYRGLLPRLAALNQLADSVAALPPNSVIVGQHSIDLDHLERAVGFLQYLESHMNRVYACAKTEYQRAEESLAEHIRNGDLKDGFTARDVVRSRWENLTSPEPVGYAIESMEELNWIRRQPASAKPARGRPTVQYEINPAVRRRAS